MRATEQQMCSLCDRAIRKGERIAKKRGHWCHAHCIEREVGE